MYYYILEYENVKPDGIMHLFENIVCNAQSETFNVIHKVIIKF